MNKRMLHPVVLKGRLYRLVAETWTTMVLTPDQTITMPKFKHYFRSNVGVVMVTGPFSFIPAI